MKVEEVKSIVYRIIGEKHLSKPSFEEFCKHPRYPFTYAWDFVKHNHKEFGFEEIPSRGDVSMMFPDGEEKYDVAVTLARGYYETIL